MSVGCLAAVHALPKLVVIGLHKVDIGCIGFYKTYAKIKTIISGAKGLSQL